MMLRFLCRPSPGPLLAIIGWLLALPSAAFAHRLDEYLQATLVQIEPGSVRLQINLTPGVEVAGQVLALIDRNRDGTISTNEATAYLESLKRDLTVRLDDRTTLDLKISSSYCPGVAELRTGWAILQAEYSVKLKPLAPGPHRITIQNRHLPGLSVYLVNAAQPKSRQIEITSQNRNENQANAEIHFTFHPAG